MKPILILIPLLFLVVSRAEIVTNITFSSLLMKMCESKYGTTNTYSISTNLAARAKVFNQRYLMADGRRIPATTATTWRYYLEGRSIPNSIYQVTFLIVELNADPGALTLTCCMPYETKNNPIRDGTVSPRRTVGVGFNGKF